MKDFKKLLIWQKAMCVTDMVFDLYEEIPWQKSAELERQSTRASISITANIAEGSSRRTEKDKLRFMEIALGSAFELETLTLLLARREWSPKAQVAALLEVIDELERMVVSFMAKLRPLKS
jgi:four helix bundle protein